MLRLTTIFLVGVAAVINVLTGAIAVDDDFELTDYTQSPLRGVSVDQLAWQAGLWIGEGPSLTWQYISCPRGGLQLGIQQDITGNRTRFFEFQRYQNVADGVVYFAQPFGHDPTPFVLIESASRRAIFENTGHDYPQRIIAEVEGATLIGRIEGTVDGESHYSEWRWQRSGPPPDCAKPGA